MKQHKYEGLYKYNNHETWKVYNIIIIYYNKFKVTNPNKKKPSIIFPICLFLATISCSLSSWAMPALSATASRRSTKVGK